MAFVLFQRLGQKEKIEFTHNLGRLLKSGLSLTESFDIIAGEATGFKKNVYVQLNSDIMTGSNLASAMAKYPKMFTLDIVNAVKAGEKSGNLEENLVNISENLRKQKRLKDKIKQAMFYPALVFGLSVIVIYFIIFNVLPKIMPIYKGLKTELPIFTRILIDVTAATKNNGLKYLLILIFIIIAIRFILKIKIVRYYFDLLKLKTVFTRSFTRKSNLAKILNALSTMLKCGLSIDESIRIVVDITQNTAYKKALNNALVALNSGTRLSDALNNPTFFPRSAISMIRIGEKSGTMEKQMSELAYIYEDDLYNQADTLSSLAEPILLLVLGLIVGSIAVAVITPIYQISSSLN